MKINEKDQRVRITKLMIRNAFLSLLTQKPIQRITVRELCEAAQINRGTFYSHYLDVYDLMEQIENELLEEFRGSLTGLLQKLDKLSSNYDICRCIFQLLESNSELTTILLGDYSNKGIIEKFTEIGKNLYIEAYRHFLPETPGEKLENYYLFISSGCIALLRQWIGSGMNKSVDELADTAVRIMTFGAGYLKD